VGQTFATQGANQPLTNRIEIGRVRWDRQLLNASTGDYQGKACSIFAVIVVLHLLRGNAEGSGFFELLSDPLIRRETRHP
jgi:hypothetical protein